MAPRFPWIGISDDGSTITLKRFDGSFPFPTSPPAGNENLRKALVLDTETTGMEPDEHHVIEIGLRGFWFDKDTGAIVAVEPGFSQLQDPGVPLSERITQITGLTDEDLKGKSIDWSQVDRAVEAAHVIIAHNAAFDRPFVEKKCTTSHGKIWACSLKQIDWETKGFPVHKLEILPLYHGVFSDSHRALSDVNALLYLLTMPGYLNELLANARRPIALVAVLDSPYETKDLLRERRYTWDRDLRHWKKVVYRVSLAEEIKWIEERIYTGPFRGVVRELPLTSNFATRA